MTIQPKAVQEEPLRIALVSGSDSLRYSSYIGHQLFARRHGYPYFLELAPFPGRGGYWHKAAALELHLDDHEWLVWLDDDAFITDLDADFIAAAISRASTNHLLIISPSCDDELNGAWAAYNTGVFALRRSPEAHTLLSIMAEPPMPKIREWWDVERLGMFTNGDQDVLVWFMESHGLQDRILWQHPKDWNARPWQYRSSLAEHPVCHFPGHADKTLAISEFAARLGVDETLVHGTRWSPRLVEAPRAQKPSASRMSLAQRRALRAGHVLRKRVRAKADWIRETGRWS